jgi:hypothetical protein
MALALTGNFPCNCRESLSAITGTYILQQTNSKELERRSNHPRAEDQYPMD